MQTLPQLQVLPVVNDVTPMYMHLGPTYNGKTGYLYATPNVSFSPTINTLSLSGNIVANNGTFTSLNVTSPITSLSASSFLSNSATFFGTTGSFGVTLQNAIETANIIPVACNTANTVYLNTGGVQYFTVAATSNWSQNITFSPQTTLNSVLAVGQVATIAVLTTQGGSAYYMSSNLTVDGSSTNITSYWQGGSPPTKGNASGVDIYTYTVLKTSSAPSYLVLQSLTQF